MPIAKAVKVPDQNWSRYKQSGEVSPHWRMQGIKLRDEDGYERTHPNAFGWKSPRTSSKSPRREEASAIVAIIPLPLSSHIAHCALQMVNQ